MGAMYRLKAYFGMVPAEEMAEYADEPPVERYASRRREYSGDRWGDSDYAAERDLRDVRVADDRGPERYDDDWDRRPVREPVRAVALERPREVVSRLDREPVRGVPAGGGLGSPAVPEQRLGSASALSRITTLQPRSYNEARTIGERYRDGVPVIMNLTELDDAAAKRLVDFAAGLAFALRGSIDKVTSRVFLLTPADVEVSADDARRLAERGLFRQD